MTSVEPKLTQRMVGDFLAQIAVKPVATGTGNVAQSTVQPKIFPTEDLAREYLLTALHELVSLNPFTIVLNGVDFGSDVEEALRNLTASKAT